MKVLAITNTAIDLAAQNAPFLIGNDVVIINTSAESRIVESSDASGSGYATIATLGAAGTETAVQVVNLDKQYIRTSSGDYLHALAN